MSAADTERRFIMTDGSSVSNEHRCPHSWFGSHQFEARYDLSPADMSALANFKARDPRYMETLRSKTYVRDICTKCGKTIERVKA